MSIEPILASALWRAEKARTDESQHAPRLLSGCRAVDQLLKPGLAYGHGGLHCVSCQENAGSAELCNALLISHLAAQSNTATIIDTQGLDLISFFATIKASLALRPHINPSLPPRDIDAEAKAMLDRLRIMRVFSFEGLLEALGEFRATCEDTGRGAEDEGAHQACASSGDGQQSHKHSSTLPDSQALSQDSDLLFDDETLFKPLKVDRTTTDTPELLKTLGNKPVPQKHQVLPEAGQSQPRPQNLLMISTLSSLLQPLQKTNSTHANALLSSLLRSLRHTTTSYNTACILVNSTLPVYTPFLISAKQPEPGLDERDRQGAKSRPEPSPSIFASCSVRPVSNNLISSGVDTHFLLHLVPKTVKDAERAYGGPPGTQLQEVGTKPPEANAKWVSCLEVIGDRYGDRMGRFGFFAVGKDGLLKDGLP